MGEFWAEGRPGYPWNHRERDRENGEFWTVRTQESLFWNHRERDGGQMCEFWAERWQGYRVIVEPYSTWYTEGWVLSGGKTQMIIYICIKVVLFFKYFLSFIHLAQFNQFSLRFLLVDYVSALEKKKMSSSFSPCVRACVYFVLCSVRVVQ